jgi:hypothetical protein
MKTDFEIVVIRVIDGRTEFKIVNTAELKAIMEGCGKALFADAEWRGVNSFEASAGLNAVAAVLGIPGPSDYYAKLCEEDPEGV